MANVNRAPHNIIPKAWAFDKEIGPFIRELLNVVWQLRIRTGGDDDIVGYSQAIIEAEDSRKLPELRQLTKRLNSVLTEIDTIKRQAAEIHALKSRIKTLEDAQNTNTELHGIKKRLNELENQVNA